MATILQVLLLIAGVGMVLSGDYPSQWWLAAIGGMLVVSSPFVSRVLEELSIPDYASIKKSARKRAERRQDAKQQQVELSNNREKIGFQYFKSTFLFAGYVAAADGDVCASEKALLEQMLQRLGLQRQQIQAAEDYFHQGCSPNFDSSSAIDEFVAVCNVAPTLCQAFIETQFAFADVNGRVVMAEFRIIDELAQRLGLSAAFRQLLDEYYQRACEYAEEQASAKVENQKRERDKRRYQAQQEKLNKSLNPKERKLRLAFAVLGLEKGASINAIKRAYRAQIKRHHPDNLLAQGYPNELLAAATQRSAEINRAYQLLKQTYKFR